MPPWDKYGSAAPRQGGVFTPPPSAKDVQGAANDAERLRIARDSEARARAAEQRALETRNAELYLKGMRIAANGQPEQIPGWTPPASIATRPTLTAKERADALAGWKSASSIEGILKNLHEQYAAGPGATHGLAGLQDYLPTAANQTFDNTANAARGYVKQALGFTGGEANTMAESGATYGPYLPTTGDRDPAIAGKMAELQRLANDARSKSIAILGGVPDANGNITPLPQGQNAFEQTYLSQGDPLAAAPNRAETQQKAIPPAMQREYDAYIAANARNLNPDAYVEFRKGLDQKYGYPSDPAKDQAYRDWATGAAQKGRTGGTIITKIPGTTVPLSDNEFRRNNLVSNPVGAAIVGAADAGGFGGVSALAPEQMSALNEKYTGPTLAGSVVGSLGGTAALGRLGRETLRRLAPRLLQGGEAGMLGRNLATDTIYGTATGTNQGLDPGTALLTSAVGSAGGQALGRIGGAAIGGLRETPAAQYLRSRGVRTTLGQSLGGHAKSIEDAMTSLPFAGDMVNARRTEGFLDYNNAALNDAGAPIGAQVAGHGEQGVNQLLGVPTPGGQRLGGAVSDAYDAATAGVTVPLDPTFHADLARTDQLGQMLPADRQVNFDKIIQNRVQPILDTGQLTGDTYQQSIRGLKGSRASAGGAAPGFEQEYRDAVSSAMDSLTGQMNRGGGQRVVEGLANADQAYRGAKTLERAMQAAKNGSQSGEIQVFTPAQLNNASTQAANRYGGGRQFADLIDAGQETLASRIPDSGTGRRVMQGVIGSGILGAGTGAGYAGGDTATGTASSVAALAALALGGTRAGQNALRLLMISRPDVAQRIGQAVSQRAGMFGAGAVPIALDSAR